MAITYFINMYTQYPVHSIFSFYICYMDTVLYCATEINVLCLMSYQACVRNLESECGGYTLVYPTLLRHGEVLKAFADFYTYMCVFVKHNGLPKQDTALQKNKFVWYCIVLQRHFPIPNIAFQSENLRHVQMLHPFTPLPSYITANQINLYLCIIQYEHICSLQYFGSIIHTQNRSKSLQ